MFPFVRAEARGNLQRLRASGQEVQEAASELRPPLGPCGGCQGRTRGQELCQREKARELQGAELQEEARVQEEACQQRDRERR